jgi:hypothetical protein
MITLMITAQASKRHVGELFQREPTSSGNCRRDGPALGMLRPMTTGSAGYSGTPLVRKLGIKPDHTVLLEAAPSGFELDGIRASRRATRETYDVILAFAPDQAQLAQQLDKLKRRIFPAGALWIAWPKRASGIPTDLTENAIRDQALPLGLVDVKVCAVDEVWSGLKLVWRKENRNGSERTAGP